MYFSLNKKIFYTIFGLMVFMAMLFLVLFLGIFGTKYSEDQNTIFLRNQYIMELLHENIILQRELDKANITISEKEISSESLTEKQEELSREQKLNADLQRNYNERYVAFIEGAKIIGVSFILSLVSIIILGFLLRKWVTTPIHKLTNLSTLVAEGDYSKRITSDTKQVFFDEFDTLTKTFNAMMDNIENSIAEIKDKETFLQSLIDGIPDGIRVIDRNYNIILTNKAYIKQLGDNAFEGKGKCYYAYKYDVPCPEGILNCPLKEIKDIKTKRINVIQNLNGKPLSINAAPLKITDNKDKDNFYIIESIRDLSDDVRFSHEQKIASLGFLATSVAHEMKNNLGSVRMILEGLLSSNYTNMANDNTEKKYLNMIYNQIIASIKLPERLLKLARNSSDEKEIFNVNNNIDEVLSLLDYEAKHNGIIVTKNFGHNENNIIGNEADFQMIILNLAKNALKAMPSGGELTISANKDRNNVIIEIKDTGIGIQREKLGHIFEPFYSDGKSSRNKGTGLGLAIVKSLIDKHKGTISVSSEVNKGTSFIIKFPKSRKNNLQI